LKLAGEIFDKVFAFGFLICHTLYFILGTLSVNLIEKIFCSLVWPGAEAAAMALTDAAPHHFKRWWCISYIKTISEENDTVRIRTQTHSTYTVDPQLLEKMFMK